MDALGNETWYAYNQWNERTMIATSEGKIEGYEYDDFGNIKTYHSPDGESFSYNYNEIGQLLSVKDPQGNTEYWKYDKHNRLEQYISKDKTEVKYFYKDHDTRLPNKGIYSNGLELEWEYNDLGQILSQRDNQGNTELWSYDKFGRLITHQLEDGVSMHWKRDVLGRVKKVYHTGQNAISIKYDAYDLPIFATNGIEDWSMEYTPMGSLKKQTRRPSTNPNKTETLIYHYDEYENLTSIRNEKNETFQFIRDSGDRVIKEISFDGQEKHYTHNRDGQVTNIKLSNNEQIFFDYDLAGRLIHTKHTDGSWEAYQYDKMGHLIEAFNEFSEVSFTRDVLGRIIRETQGEHHIDYEYDARGNLRKLKSSLGADLDYQYHPLGHLQKIHSTPQALDIVHLHHNSKGQIARREMLGGIEQNFSYDPQGRLLEMSVLSKHSAEKKHHTSLHWNQGERLAYILNQLTGGKTQFAYDAFGNLQSAQYQDGSYDYKMPDAVGNLYRSKDQTDRTYHKGGKLLHDEKYHYLYDPNGNLKLKTPRKVAQRQIDLRQEQLNAHKPKKFSFFVEEVPQHKTKDLNYYLRNDRIYTQAEKEEYKRLKAQENLQTLQDQQWQRGDWEYHWNANGSLKSVKLPDGNLVEYEYDALGRRTKKTFNNKIIRYLWDSNVLLHEWEYEKENAPCRVVNSLGEVSFNKPEPVNNLITWVYETGSFVPCAKIIGNETFSIVNDYIGRPIQAYDNNGNLIWSCDYDIYGNLRNLKGERDFVPFRQLGQYEDVETGLYYNRFRYYDPESGTYISKDPISILGGLNVYAYVKDVNTWVDVLGLNPITNKFPMEAMPIDGKNIPFQIIDGKIKGVGGQRQFDFVVTKNNQLIIGKKHHYLGQAQDVLAAGQMRLNGQGQIRGIDNLSGHYKPTLQESLEFPTILKNTGVDLSGATLDIYTFEIDENGMVKRFDKTKTIKCT